MNLDLYIKEESNPATSTPTNCKIGRAMLDEHRVGQIVWARAFRSNCFCPMVLLLYTPIVSGHFHYGVGAYH